MSKPDSLDEVRRSALEMAESSRLQWVRAMVLFAVLEGVGWISYVLLAWFDFPVSVLIGVAAVVLYAMMFGWAVALKDQLDVNTRRVLKAIEALAEREPDKQD
jgi:hypothetical protein